MKKLIATAIFILGAQSSFATQATRSQVAEIQVTEKEFEPDSIDMGQIEKRETRFACGMDMATGEILVR